MGLSVCDHFYEVLMLLLFFVVIVIGTRTDTSRLEQDCDHFSWEPQRPQLHTFDEAEVESFDAIKRYANYTGDDYYSSLNYDGWPIERNPRQTDGEEEEGSDGVVDPTGRTNRVAHYWAHGDQNSLSVDYRMLAFIVKDGKIPDCGATAPKKLVRRHYMCSGVFLSRYYVLTTITCMTIPDIYNFNILDDVAVVGNVLGNELFVIRTEPFWYGHPDFTVDPESEMFLKHDLALVRLTCPVPSGLVKYPMLPRGIFDDISHFCCRDSCRLVMMEEDHHKSFTLMEIYARDLGDPRHRYKFKGSEDPRYLSITRARRAANESQASLTKNDLSRMRTRVMSKSLSGSDQEKIMNEAKSSMSEEMAQALLRMVDFVTDKDKLATQFKQVAEEEPEAMANVGSFRGQFGKRIFKEACLEMYPKYFRKYCRQHKEEFCETCYCPRCACDSCCRPCNCVSPPCICPHCNSCCPTAAACPPAPSSAPCPEPTPCPTQPAAAAAVSVTPAATACPTQAPCKPCPTNAPAEACPPCQNDADGATAAPSESGAGGASSDPSAALAASIAAALEASLSGPKECSAKPLPGLCPPSGTPLIKDNILIGLVSTTCEKELPNIPLTYVNINDNTKWLSELPVKWD